MAMHTSVNMSADSDNVQQQYFAHIEGRNKNCESKLRSNVNCKVYELLKLLIFAKALYAYGKLASLILAPWSFQD